ncbi:putative SOS response-associated peptidase YedK [compost metagenome]
MCFHSQQTADAQKLKNRFKAEIKEADKNNLTGIFNGFDHKRTPVILNAEPNLIQCVEWGLMPSWAKDRELQNSTLNAKIETLQEKPSFKGVLHQKCLVVVDGFFGWQWLDEKGKSKQKYLITMPDNEPFAFAGLWSEWKGPLGEILRTYTIITTEAKGIMQEIHNSKLRMPVVLKPEIEHDWLMGKTNAKLFTELKAEKV